jgi:hypothetical protein
MLSNPLTSDPPRRPYGPVWGYSSPPRYEPYGKYQGERRDKSDPAPCGSAQALILSIPVAFKQLTKQVCIYPALATSFLHSYQNRLLGFYVAKANRFMFSFISSLKWTAIDFLYLTYSSVWIRSQILLSFVCQVRRALDLRNWWNMEPPILRIFEIPLPADLRPCGFSILRIFDIGETLILLLSNSLTSDPLP